MYFDPLSRKCLKCGMTRIPDTKTVKEGRQKYVIYTCRICRMSDIERWADRPRPKIWSDGAFIEDLSDIDLNEDGEN